MSARNGAAMTYDPNGQYVLLWGGDIGGTGTCGQTHPTQAFTFSGGIWTELSTTSWGSSNAILGYSNQAMVYDASDGFVIMEGGWDGCNPHYDTWRWWESNDSWQDLNLAPPNAPAIRSNQAYTYDSSDGYVVIYGGDDASTPYADTWYFHAGIWTEACASCGPGLRDGALMTYDFADGYVVLFGGCSTDNCGGSGNVWHSDTWKFAAGSWTNITSSGPSARAWVSIVYDGNDGYTVLFGGEATTGSQGDTWLFGPPPSVSSFSCSPANLDLGQSISCAVALSGGIHPINTVSYVGTGCSPSPTTLAFSCKPSPAGTYNPVVTVKDFVGNSATGTTTYTVYADPIVSVSPPGPLTYDAGQAASQLTATHTHNANNDSIEWYSWASVSCGPASNNTGISGTTYTPPTAVVGTTYYCAVITDSGVPGYTNTSNAVKVTVNSITLVSVAVSPTAAIVGTGETTPLFTATPTCSIACPAGILYNWSLSTARMGSLTMSHGNTTAFTAGDTAGTVGLFVNATLNGVTVQSSTALITIAPPLTSVTVNPVSGAVQVGKTLTFSATAACGSNQCPSGTTYTWTLNSTLGSIEPSTGSSTTFTAGPMPGMVALTVSASLSGVDRVATADINITLTTVPILTGVALSITSATVQEGGAQEFTATPVCSSESCGTADIAYTWSMNNNLGKLNLTTGTSVTFTAGNTTGEVTLTVVANFNGNTAIKNATINVTKESGSGSSPLLSGTTLVVIVLIVAAAACIVSILIARKKKDDTHRLPKKKPQGDVKTPVDESKASPSKSTPPVTASPPVAQTKTKPSASRIYCPVCGTPNDEGLSLCKGCGKRIPTTK